MHTVFELLLDWTSDIVIKNSVVLICVMLLYVLNSKLTLIFYRFNQIESS